VTTIFVTHDQEEAMEVAEQIVVINEGRIEQAGGPTDLYEQPANPFVMSFVGPVNQLGEAWVRPHDVELLLEAREGTTEAIVERIARLGFEVRVSLSLSDGTAISAQVTRAELEELDLHDGDIVHVRPHSSRMFTP
jgi:sulfate/thiosulfate transport system ATP-binding protein